jgi:membrane associated rhomboid family serine protease
VAERCYRHPNRETSVSCSNCGRPICTDCMTSTSVGMRCPECAGERTRVRRGAAAFAPTGAPVATFVFIALNVIAFIAELGTGGAVGTFDSGGSLIRDGALIGPAIADGGEWYRIITAGFLHAGVLHIALNMFVLYVLGNLLEPGIGSVRFAAIYLVSLIAGSFGALVVTPDSLTVGASGAVYGVMAATIVIARGRGLDQIASEIGVWLLLNLLLTFAISGISIGGHIGGLIGGVLAALLVVGAERFAGGRRALAIEAIGMLVLAAASFGGALWAAGQPGL